MEIDNSSVHVEFYGAFYQTERMLMASFFEICKYIFFCRCFSKENDVLYPVEDCRKSGNIII